MKRRPSIMELLEGEREALLQQIVVLDARRADLEIAIRVLRELDEPQLPAPPVTAKNPSISAARAERKAEFGIAPAPPDVSNPDHPVGAGILTSANAAPAIQSQANASMGNAATAEDESQGDSGSGEASRLSGGSGPVAPIQNADALRARPPAGAVNDATAPAPTRAEIIRGLHAEHPEWTAPDIARHLGIIPQKVVKAATRAGIVLPKGKPGRRKPETRPNGRPRQPERLLSRIRAHIADHPDASSVDCAAALGTTVEKVRNSIKGSGVVLAPAKRGPNSAAHPAPQPQDRAAAPAQPPAPSSPARTNVASMATGRTSPSAVVTKPVHRPSGTRFHLRDAAGRYLRFDCLDMTDDRTRAWIGDERQLAGCRRAFSLAADLREVPVPKEERAA